MSENGVDMTYSRVKENEVMCYFGLADSSY